MNQLFLYVHTSLRARPVRSAFLFGLGIGLVITGVALVAGTDSVPAVLMGGAVGGGTFLGGAFAGPALGRRLESPTVGPEQMQQASEVSAAKYVEAESG